MTAIETIMEDLKRLPPDKIEEAAWYVHALIETSDSAKADVLKRTATALSAEDVDEMEKAIAEACEDTDEHAW